MVADSWVVEHLGAVAADISEAIACLYRRAQEAGESAQDASGLRNAGTFGTTFSNAVREHQIEELSSVPGISFETIHGHHQKFPVINGTAILLTKCVSTAGPGQNQLQINRSQFRDDLLNEAPQSGHSTLNFMEWDDALHQTLQTGEPFTAVALVVAVASAMGGLQKIYIGEGTLERDGNITWLDVEEIKVGKPKPVALQDVSASRPRFDDIAAPEITFDLQRTPEKTVPAT